LKPLVGFTFIHNALAGGYPVFEAIASVLPFVDRMEVLDLGCSDGTEAILNEINANPKICITKLPWELSLGPKMLVKAWGYHEEVCTSGEVVWHFEADEVFDVCLADRIGCLVKHQEATSLACYRLQVEQNFQRVRWYPTLCHRVWKPGSVTRRGHTTQEAATATVISPLHGFCWDCAYCFRDQYHSRRAQNLALWQDDAPHRIVQEHVASPWEVSEARVQEQLQEPHWTWGTSPFRLPELLLPWVGQPRYSPSPVLLEALAKGDDQTLLRLNGRP